MEVTASSTLISCKFVWRCSAASPAHRTNSGAHARTPYHDAIARSQKEANVSSGPSDLRNTRRRAAAVHRPRLARGPPPTRGATSLGFSCSRMRQLSIVIQ